MPSYVVNVDLLVQADSPEEVADGLSAILTGNSQPHAPDSCLLDWRYVLGQQGTTLREVIIPLDYEEDQMPSSVCEKALLNVGRLASALHESLDVLNDLQEDGATRYVQEHVLLREIDGISNNVDVYLDQDPDTGNWTLHDNCADDRDALGSIIVCEDELDNHETTLPEALVDRVTHYEDRGYTVIAHNEGTMPLFTTGSNASWFILEDPAGLFIEQFHVAPQGEISNSGSAPKDVACSALVAIMQGSLEDETFLSFGDYTLRPLSMYHACIDLGFNPKEWHLFQAGELRAIAQHLDALKKGEQWEQTEF